MTQATPTPSEVRSSHPTRSPASPGAGSRPKIRARHLWLGFALLSVSPLMAQGPSPAPPAAQPAPAANNAPAGEKKEFNLSRDGGAFDPGSEGVTWQGKNWNIKN